MNKRWLASLALSFSLLHAGALTGSTAKETAMPSDPEVFVIEVHDQVQLVLDGKAKKPAFEDNSAVKIEVREGRMVLRASRDKAASDQVPIVRWGRQDHFKHIQEIVMHDRSQLWASHMRAPTVLRQHSQGSIVLDGYIPLALLEQRGSGHVSIRFVNAEDAEMLMLKGSAELAGTAKRLRYRAAHEASVDAKALRVDHLWAEVKGSSLSFLMPIQTAHTMVSGRAQLILENKAPYFSALASDQGQLIYNNLFALNP